MSSVLTIDGKEYVPATTAGRHFGYTKDYLLMLIKGGNIEGQKIGHKWYVHIPSAEVFFKTAEARRIEKRKTISLERKAELKQHTRARSQSHPHIALVETLVIVIIGLSLGTAGYLGTSTQTAQAIQSQNNDGFLAHLARSLYTLVASNAPHTAEVIDTTTEPTTPALIVQPTDIFTEDTVAAVRDSFSDPVTVSVDPAHRDTGIITPQFKDTEGTPYRFLMVPIKTMTQ